MSEKNSWSAHPGEEE